METLLLLPWGCERDWDPGSGGGQGNEEEKARRALLAKVWRLHRGDRIKAELMTPDRRMEGEGQSRSRASR